MRYTLIITGTKNRGRPIGYRAPAFSINKDTQWALEILAELGYKYDSSIWPAKASRYGWSEFSNDICKVNLPNGQSILEVPMSTISLRIKSLGIGGGYLRHFPYIYTKLAIKYIQKKRSTILYMHPYEIDTEQIALNFDNTTKKEQQNAIKFHKLQMSNRKSVKGKVYKLLNEFQFTTIKELLNDS